jgi:hypothetical protein
MKNFSIILISLIISINANSQCSYSYIPKTAFYVNGVATTAEYNTSQGINSDSITVFQGNNTIHATGVLIITFKRLYNVSDIKISGCGVTVPLLALTTTGYGYTPVFSSVTFRYLNIRQTNEKQQVYAIKIYYTYNSTGYSGGGSPYTFNIYLTDASTPFQNGYASAKANCNK